MIITGKYNSAKVFTNNIEESAIIQIKELLNQEFIKDSKIRIMPDVHSGAGCVIGTTMTIKDKIIPNLVGVDIGCGMLVAKLNIKDNKNILKKIDEIINKYIPSGFNIRNEVHFNIKDSVDNLYNLKCLDYMDIDNAKKSLGTLGGGNHFIELNKDSSDNIYIVIHSGSRNLGLQVANYYQISAYLQQHFKLIVDDIVDKNISNIKVKRKTLNEKIKEIKKNNKNISFDLSYVSGSLFDDYINDMDIIINYAKINRETILFDILYNLSKIGVDVEIVDKFTTIHNYIDTANMILRKGSVSAQKSEKYLLPLNMKDGSLICLGKGNEDWNYSSPHGAGRLMSRSEAKKNIDLDKFKEVMKGIYSTSVTIETIDEAPMVYKNKKEIVENIKVTADIIDHLIPIYNFKAKE